MQNISGIFVYPPWTIFLDFWHFGGTFAGSVTSKFCLVGGALFGARALQKTPGETVPGSIPPAARLQHIWLDIDDDEHNEHERDLKDNEDNEDEGADDEDEVEGNDDER